MSPDSAPAAVVLRTGRVRLLVGLVVAGVVELGIVAALVRAAMDGSFTVGGEATSWRGTGILFAVLIPLGVLVGLALAALVLAMLHPLNATVVDSGDIRVLAGGRVRTRITLADATGIVYHPALPAVGKDSTADDPSPREGGDRRLPARLEVSGPGGSVELSDTRRWAEVVEVLRGWAASRPELVADADTEGLLLGRHFP